MTNPNSPANKNTRGNLLLTAFFVVFALTLGFVAALVISDDGELRETTTTVTATEAPRSVESSTTIPPKETDIGLELPLSSLDGQWSAPHGDSEFVAQVDGDSIQIRLEDDNLSVIYWNGTFGEMGPDNALTSKIVEINKAVLSQANSKVFRIEGDTLLFEFEAMGVTKTVGMTRA